MTQLNFIERALKKVEIDNDKLIRENNDTKEKIEDYKIMIAVLKRRKLEGWKELVVTHKDCINKSKKYLELMPQMYLNIKKNTVVLTRLLVIAQYISTRICDYPVEYDLWDEDDICEDYAVDSTRCNMVLKVKNEDSSHRISVCVPWDSFYINNGVVKWWMFAELMIYNIRNGEKYYYCRRDFELVGKFDNSDDDKDFDDEIFLIYNLKELGIIFQKFDSWYGSGLD